MLAFFKSLVIKKTPFLNKLAQCTLSLYNKLECLSLANTFGSVLCLEVRWEPAKVELQEIILNSYTPLKICTGVQDYLVLALMVTHKQFTYLVTGYIILDLSLKYRF
jgi:hypothetical protein